MCNIIGVMACPKSQTQDGFETQFGVNHLGHFLFTSLLLPRIRNSAPARIVNVASMAHISQSLSIIHFIQLIVIIQNILLGGSINFDDLNNDKSYSSMAAYSQSKLANILFSKELAQRLKGEIYYEISLILSTNNNLKIMFTYIGTGVNVYSLHPGIVRTELNRTFDQVYFRGMWFLFSIVVYPWMKTPEQGAQTTLYCSIDEKAGEETGLYYRFDF